MNFIIQETCSIYTTSIIFVNPGQKSSRKYKANCRYELSVIQLKRILKSVLKKHVDSNKSLRKEVANCQKQGKYEATLNHRDIFKTAMEILLHHKTYFTLQTV